LTERHPLFKPSADDSEEKFKIYPIEHLLSSAKRLNKIITMGLFSQLKVGCYHLEDPTGIVQLDLSETISFSKQQQKYFFDCPIIRFKFIIFF